MADNSQFYKSAMEKRSHDVITQPHSISDKDVLTGYGE